MCLHICVWPTFFVILLDHMNKNDIQIGRKGFPKDMARFVIQKLQKFYKEKKEEG